MCRIRTAINACCQIRLTLLTTSCAAALIFWGVGAFDVGLAVFTGRLRFLAERMLPCSQDLACMSIEDRVQLLRTRLRPVCRRASVRNF